MASEARERSGRGRSVGGIISGVKGTWVSIGEKQTRFARTYGPGPLSGRTWAKWRRLSRSPSIAVMMSPICKFGCPLLPADGHSCNSWSRKHAGVRFVRMVGSSCQFHTHSRLHLNPSPLSLQPVTLSRLTNTVVLRDDDTKAALCCSHDNHVSLDSFN